MATNWLQKAQDRVDHDNLLEQHRETIFADWNEGEQHFEWVATAKREEIADWADGIESAAEAASDEDVSLGDGDCPCGWSGKGTGRNGMFVKGDRCPDCGETLA